MHISREVTVYYTVTGTCGRITVGTSHMDEDYDITLLYWKPNKNKNKCPYNYKQCYITGTSNLPLRVLIVTVCVFVRHLFSWYPFYFDFHSARIIFDVSSGFYLWNINNTKADICKK
jgi:hypothetical protein